MGYGNGWFWHNLLNVQLPKFTIITKTLTIHKRTGYPFLFIKCGNSFWNHMSLPNYGINNWIIDANMGIYDINNVVVSISGTDSEINEMISLLDSLNIYGIELNFSCPNIKRNKNKIIPKTHHKLSLKLNCQQDPYNYDLSSIYKISVNSVPMIGGGVSGKLAQKYNWPWIKKFAKDLPVSGCSWQSYKDLQILSSYGCKIFDIGTILFINPKLIASLYSNNT